MSAAAERCGGAETALKRPSTSDAEAARFAQIGRAVAAKARVAVHNYPCCGKVVRGRVAADGYVVLEDGGGFEYDFLARQYRVEVRI